mmetsp:Transcript_13651/g.34834  ORF Transcript_13651/g.34834 Transcript_13651/m.34834 type:complete len:309 (-) Transcript_13651:542-1468(-)
MHDTESGSRTEACPMRGTLQPLEVLAKELIVGGTSMHDGVRKHSGVVRNQVTHLNRFLDVLEKTQIRLVVAREEIQLQCNALLAGEDGMQLLEARVRRVRGSDGRKSRAHRCQELLRCALAQIEGCLVGDENVVRVVRRRLLNQTAENGGDACRVVQENQDLALAKVVRLLESTVQLHQQFLYAMAPITRDDLLLAHSEAIVEHLMHILRTQEACLHQVQAVCFNGDAERLLEGAVGKATLEHAVHDGFETGVHLSRTQTSSNVLVDALCHQRVHKLGTCLHVEERAGVEGVLHGSVQITQMIVHLGN